MEPIDIRDAPYGWTTADPAAVERARTDGGLRASIARALWRLGEQPGAEAQIGGYVYEIADGAVAGLAEQGLIIVRADAPRAVTQEALVPLNARLTAAEAAVQRIRELHQPTEGAGYDCDEDDTPGSYGRIAHVCTSCGTHGEYGVRWPCPTIRALDGDDELERLRKRWRHAVEAADALTKRAEAAEGVLARVQADCEEVSSRQVTDDGSRGWWAQARRTLNIIHRSGAVSGEQTGGKEA